MASIFIKDLLSQLGPKASVTTQQRPEFREWINSDLVDIVEEFVREYNLCESYFIRKTNATFKTVRFILLLKKWMVEYFLELFRVLHYHRELILEDNPLNRFGIKRYFSRFGSLPEIKWKRQPGLMARLASILWRTLGIFYLSLNKGLKISGKRKKYKVMREALWGLYDVGGYYFHDDFLVDGGKIKKEDLLLFSRGNPAEKSRLEAYHDAKKSPYAYFNLQSLPLGIKPLFSRIIPKYIISSSRVLFKEICSVNFSLYWSIYLYFIYSALPYEKVFSHFEIVSELGHNYFSAGHIPEAIICQNYGTRYYLMHWSDHSIRMDKYMVSFLGCDKFLLWGKVHLMGTEGHSSIFEYTGYVFKRCIKKVIDNKNKVLSDMNICKKGKIISFFDESFGAECKMTGENYVTFWETALKLAEREQDSTIIVKPKEISRYNNLSDNLKGRFLNIKDKIENMPNMYLIPEQKWPFIECIGVSDIVITQGMFSSATIAIICGIQGLYLDQAQYRHPFSRFFKDRIVFDDPEKALSMISKIIKGIENPLRDISEGILMAYDAYSDDCAIDRFRGILTVRSTKYEI